MTFGKILAAIRQLFHGDLKNMAAATDGQVLTKQADGSWAPEAVSGSATAAGWTDAGSTIGLETAGDGVGIGAVPDANTKFRVLGDATRTNVVIAGGAGPVNGGSITLTPGPAGEGGVAGTIVANGAFTATAGTNTLGNWTLGTDITSVAGGYISARRQFSASSPTALQSGMVIFASPGGGTHVINLPAAVAGLYYTVITENAGTVTWDAPGGVYIVDETGESTAGGTLSAVAAGNEHPSSTVVCDGVNWHVMAKTGTWTLA